MAITKPSLASTHVWVNFLLCGSKAKLGYDIRVSGIVSLLFLHCLEKQVVSIQTSTILLKRKRGFLDHFCHKVEGVYWYRRRKVVELGEGNTLATPALRSVCLAC